MPLEDIRYPAARRASIREPTVVTTMAVRQEVIRPAAAPASAAEHHAAEEHRMAAVAAAIPINRDFGMSLMDREIQKWRVARCEERI